MDNKASERRKSKGSLFLNKMFRLLNRLFVNAAIFSTGTENASEQAWRKVIQVKQSVGSMTKRFCNKKIKFDKGFVLPGCNAASYMAYRL